MPWSPYHCIMIRQWYLLSIQTDICVCLIKVICLIYHIGYIILYHIRHMILYDHSIILWSYDHIYHKTYMMKNLMHAWKTVGQASPARAFNMGSQNFFTLLVGVDLACSDLHPSFRCCTLWDAYSNLAMTIQATFQVNTPSVYANTRLQAGGGVDLDPPPPPNGPRGGGSTLKFSCSWS